MSDEEYVDSEGDWQDDTPQDEREQQNPQQAEIQRLLQEIEKKAKNAMRYLLLEGFLETTDTPGEYKYTPEGLVLAQIEYKRLKTNGLI